MEQVDPIERAVLRIAGFELRYRPDVPYRVVINEAIETTKRFGAEHGHTYVNQATELPSPLVGVTFRPTLLWASEERLQPKAAKVREHHELRADRRATHDP